jgi:exopolysaccharide biosynthesis polyprenyl glycosylphosphotransferase
MIATRRKLLLTALKAFDLCLVSVCFVGAASVWAPTISSFEQLLSVRITLANSALFAALLATWHLIFRGAGVYDSKRLATHKEELANHLKAALIATATIYLFAVAFRITIVRKDFIAVFFSAYVALSIAGRIALRAFLRAAREHGRNLHHVVIVGTNARAIAFAQSIEAKPDWGCRITGFLDERIHEPSRGELERAGYRLLGGLADLPQLLRTCTVDQVAIFLPLESQYHQAMEVARRCVEQGIPVKVSSRLFDLPCCTTSDFSDDHLIDVSRDTWAAGPVFVKRALDVAVSALLLVLLAPLLAVVALLVKLTSQGPAFFVQERLGVGKRRFRMYKFRTMVADAELRQRGLESLNEVTGPVFKIRNDPRITRLGVILRKTSIDELPQLINVLKGDLSLVGPRPLPARDYEGFDKDWHRRRFSVKPGITCLWQISGRSNISFEQWMELDVQYIDTWSLWLDLKILLKTIPAILRGTGAV